MLIGIIGMGMVGKAVHDVMRDVGHTTASYDPKYPGSKLSDVADCEIVFVCVPTKPGKDNKCDLSILNSVLQSLHELEFKGVICIKSTVLPGTTDALIDGFQNLNICFCPEFLRERCAYEDYRYRNPICIVGARSDSAYSAVVTSHASVSREFKRVAPKEAELTKYFQNVYNTNRILFANAFYEVCEKEGVQYDSVVDSLLKRNEMDDKYLRCNPALRGPSGPCLVKDTLAFRAYVADLNLPVRPLHFEAMVHDMGIYPRTVISGTRSEEEYFGDFLAQGSSSATRVYVPVSVGELFDKISILKIKFARVTDLSKLENVKKELDALLRIKDALPRVEGSEVLFDKLLKLNEAFWEYHNWQREAWKATPLPQEDLMKRTREEHVMNDARALLKKQINSIFNSEYVEEKQFVDYGI